MDVNLSAELPAPGNPMGVARVLIQDHQTDGELTLRHWRGAWMQWLAAHWNEAEDQAIKSWLYARVERAQYWDAKAEELPRVIQRAGVNVTTHGSLIRRTRVDRRRLRACPFWRPMRSPAPLGGLRGRLLVPLPVGFGGWPTASATVLAVPS
jgi:hypothetical protein